MRGFTLVETLVGVFIFLIISLGIYQGFFSASKLVTQSKMQTEAALLADEQFELIHNLPYQSVGILNGIPAGALPRAQTFLRSGVTFFATTTIRNIDDPFDGTIGGTPNDTSPADYKQVALTINCAGCSLASPLIFTTTVSPKNLESATGNGALFINVIDANGQPVAQATVHVENRQRVPNIVIDETTDNAGKLQLVDVPPGNNAYAVTATKAGYSSDRTYPITDDNPNPTSPDLTISAGQVTAKTFSIDRVGNLNLSTLSNNCSVIANVPFTLTGKLIGADPEVYKYSQNFSTDGAGNKLIGNLEWDNYDVLITGGAYDLAGSMPFLPIPLLPAATQNVSLVLAPHSAKALLVIVEDAVTGLPVANSSVLLKRGSTTIGTKVTDRGFLSQTSWAGASGQADFVDATSWFADSGVDHAAGGVTLHQIGHNNYSTAGTLTSSTFDVGSTTSSTFYDLTPTQSLNTGTYVKSQIATDSTSTPVSWNFRGPDGTAATYYTATTTSINAINTGKEYLRYKLYLSGGGSRTPTLSGLSITYGNNCLPYGQVFWSGLSTGTYKVTVTRSGYQTYSNSTISVADNWQRVVVPLQPS